MFTVRVSTDIGPSTAWLPTAEPPAEGPPAADGPQHTGAVRLATGEAVEFDIRVARIGSRVPALLLDLLVQMILLTVLLIGLLLGATAALGPHVDGALGAAIGTVSLVLALLGYPVAMETLTSGRTLGKLAMGLRVVRDDGGPIGFRQSLTRALVRLALELPGLIPPLTSLASLWTMLADPRGRRIGDLAAGTMVIHERAPIAWGGAPGMPPGLAGWASALDLTGLDDDLALAVRQFLSRTTRLREPARSALGLSLAREVSALTTPPAPPGTAGYTYLTAVLAERHRRAALRLRRARTATVLVWPDLDRT